jgi:hypothetical protein
VYTPTVYTFSLCTNNIYPLGHSNAGFPGSGGNSSIVTFYGNISISGLGGDIKKDDDGYLYI